MTLLKGSIGGTFVKGQTALKLITWSDSIPAAKYFFDSRADSMPSAILECFTRFRKTTTKFVNSNRVNCIGNFLVCEKKQHCQVLSTCTRILNLHPTHPNGNYSYMHVQHTSYFWQLINSMSFQGAFQGLKAIFRGACTGPFHCK